MKNKILQWEVIGIIFVIILGTLFHFLFEWLYSWPPIGAITAVNESVWEHLKLPYWPLIIFSFIEYNYIKTDIKNFIIGKASAALISIGTILIVFYSYTAILGIEILIIDILSFFIGVIIGQLVSYKIITLKKLQKWINVVSWIIVIGLGLSLILFTYLPPHLPIFQDSESGLYGIF
ncbi:MAG: hypothetical protein HWN81_09870 [Candidatus Lokiarchaeota archaeon]|nr:hypothetical protein [Candidatus Lokiarchaeota archaeon]